MKRIQKLLAFSLALVMILSTVLLVNAKDIGKTLDHLNDIPVIFVKDPKVPLEANVDSRSLIFRYEADATNPNYLWNGKSFNEAPPALTETFAKAGYISLKAGDVITYNNKFGQTVRFEALTDVPDLGSVVHKYSFNPIYPLTIGTQRPFIKAIFDISIIGENKPSYVSFSDLDYSDSVAVRKSDITNIIVIENTNITYVDDGEYITFHGLQGRESTTNADPKSWVTVLLKNSNPRVKFAVGNYTLISFENTHLFPEGEDYDTGNVYVKHITEDGEILKDTTAVIEDARLETEYSTKSLDFEGYVFSRMDDTSAPAVGTVKKEDQTVIYVYKKIVPTTEATIENTTETTTESTTEATTQSTTEATTQSTTENTTEATTQSTTEATTESTTEATTESTAESTAVTTTESTKASSSEATETSTTQASSEYQGGGNSGGGSPSPNRISITNSSSNTPKESSTVSITQESVEIIPTSTTPRIPKTADNTNILVYLSFALLGLISSAILIKKR